MADKYGAKAILDWADLHFRALIVASADPPKLFGFAMSHGLIPAARIALGLFQKSFQINQISESSHPCVHSEVKGGLPYLITDIPKADLARLPFEVFLALERAQTAVLLHGYSWAERASYVQVRKRSPAHVHCSPSLTPSSFLSA